MAALLLVAILTAPPSADSNEGIPTADLAAWLKGPGRDLAQRNADQLVTSAQERLAAVKKAIVNPKLKRTSYKTTAKGLEITCPSREAKKDLVAETTTALEDAKRAALADQTPIVPTLAAWNFAVGKSGRLRQFARDRSEADECTITQVVGPDRALASMRSDKAPVAFFLEVPTKGLTDGATYVLGDVVYSITDTETYKTTAGGTRTVFVVKPAK